MERFVDSYPLGKMWSKMTWAAKEKLVEDVAGVLAQLSSLNFDATCSIYQQDGSYRKCALNSTPHFMVGRIVSMEFIWGTISLWAVSVGTLHHEQRLAVCSTPLCATRLREATHQSRY